MCISNILFVASNPADTVQLSTKNAYLKGTCNSTQSAFITATWPKSKQLLPENSILDSAAVNGGNTGVVSVSSDYSVNLVRKEEESVEITSYINYFYSHSIYRVRRPLPA